MKRSELAMYFTHVASLGNDEVVIAGHLYAFEHEHVTRLLTFKNGKWKHLADLPEIVSYLLTIPKNTYTEIYALLRNGVIHKWIGENHSVEIIDEKQGLFFNEIRLIGEHLYACGTNQQVFYRSSKGWIPIDKGVFTGVVKPAKIFTSIDGRSEQDIYTVGTEGTIYHFDGSSWTSLKSPTNYGLTKVIFINNYIYIIGYHGLVLCGDKEGWEILNYQKGEPLLTDIINFNNRIFLTSEFDIYQLNKKMIEPLNIKINQTSFGSFAMDKDYLWSTGGETLLKYNSNTWEEFPFPWNAEV